MAGGEEDGLQGIGAAPSSVYNTWRAESINDWSCASAFSGR